MPNVNLTPFEIETISRHDNLVRADVCLPKGVSSPLPVVLGASPYQKALRWLPVIRPGISNQDSFVACAPITLWHGRGDGYRHLPPQPAALPLPAPARAAAVIARR